MPQDKKPLFPRESESDAEAQSDLLNDVKQKLEAAEQESEVELPGLKKQPLPPQGPRPPAPAYGPPPFINPRRPLFYLILIFFLVVLFAVYLIVRFLFAG